MRDLKQLVLQETNGGEDFYLLVLGKNLRKADSDRYENTYNPFYDDRKPSFSVYNNPTDEFPRWYHIDYGDDSYKGDVFNFAAEHYELDVVKDFYLILRNMLRDLNIKLDGTSTKTLPTPDGKSLTDENEEDWEADTRAELLPKGSNGFDAAYEYFKPFGITAKIIKRFGVKAINGYKIFNSKEELISYKPLAFLDTVIAYPGQGFTKIYVPNPKSFWHVGRRDRSYVFGLSQLLTSTLKDKRPISTLVITAGEKDVLTLVSLGLDAITFNSETAKLPQILVESNVIAVADKIVIAFDIDETGKKRSIALQEEIKSINPNVFVYTLPEKLAELGGKDVSDYIKLGLPAEELKLGIESVSDNANPISDTNIKENTATGEAVTITGEKSNSQIPQTVYDTLPPIMKGMTDLFTDPMEKDLILLSALSVISSFMPTVSGIHDGNWVGTNLYLFISAPAASGKGVIKFSRKLGRGIHNLLLKNKQTLFIPGDISSSKIVQHLYENKNVGIIFETEGDTLKKGLKSEHGGFTELLRGAFHHEPITLSRRTGDEHLEIEKPQLSIVLSGTLLQINAVVDNVENGFFSRFMWYDFEGANKWKNQFAVKDNQREVAFSKLSDYFLEFWQTHQSAAETMIALSEEQIKWHTDYFTHLYEETIQLYGEGIDASIKRLGLIAYRIVMVLTALRHYEDGKPLPAHLAVNDDDFVNAIEIVHTSTFSLQRVFSRLAKVKQQSKMNPQLKTVFDSLPIEFTTSQYDEIIVAKGIKIPTGKKYLKDLKKLKAITRIAHGQYKKTQIL